MHQRDHARIWGRLGVRGALIMGIAGSACYLSVPALAGPAGPARAASGNAAGAGRLTTGPVSPVPQEGTPTLVDTGTTEQIRQLVQCGQNMYAVGTFTQIKQGSITYSRNNVFSFNALTPYLVNPWAPDVNGTVDTITFSGGNCADAYIGGHFSTVGGVTAKNIAEIDTTTGALVPGFNDTASGEVDTLLGVNGHLLAGGVFKGIGGSTTDPYMASLSPVTGKDDGFVHLNISGHYVYPGVGTNPTKVYNQQLSNGGTLDLVEGDFTSVGSLPRQQIFMLDLSGAAATVTGWSSPEWDGSRGNLPHGYGYQCSVKESFYLRAAAWSPDDSTIYTATTGYEPWNWSARSPRTGLCDSVAAFPAVQTEVTHEWINYTGCDSLYSVASDSSAVYIAGHERWADNANGCNGPGFGSVPAPGIGGFTPAGSLLENSGNNAGLYSRSRGRGADDLLVTSAGLWVASDNFGGNTSCGGNPGHSGICFLQYPQTP
jgi:hypothetical protein